MVLVSRTLPTLPSCLAPDEQQRWPGWCCGGHFRMRHVKRDTQEGRTLFNETLYWYGRCSFKRREEERGEGPHCLKKSFCSSYSNGKEQFKLVRKQQIIDKTFWSSICNNFFYFLREILRTGNHYQFLRDHVLNFYEAFRICLLRMGLIQPEVCQVWSSLSFILVNIKQGVCLVDTKSLRASRKWYKALATLWWVYTVYNLHVVACTAIWILNKTLKNSWRFFWLYFISFEDLRSYYTVY